MKAGFVKLGVATSHLMDGWDSSDDPETLKSLPLLKAVNELGFVTTNSQIGNFVKNPRHDDGHVMKGHEYRQRAYINGIVHKSAAARLAKLSHTTDLAVNMLDGSKDASRKQDEVLFSFGCRVPVRVQRNKGGKAAFKETTWSSPYLSWSYEWSNLMPIAARKDKQLSKKLQNDGLCVQIVDMQWGRPFHALQKLLQALQS